MQRKNGQRIHPLPPAQNTRKVLRKRARRIVRRILNLRSEPPSQNPSGKGPFWRLGRPEKEDLWYPASAKSVQKHGENGPPRNSSGKFVGRTLEIRRANSSGAFFGRISGRILWIFGRSFPPSGGHLSRARSGDIQHFQKHEPPMSGNCG